MNMSFWNFNQIEYMSHTFVTLHFLLVPAIFRKIGNGWVQQITVTYVNICGNVIYKVKTEFLQF